MTEFHLPWMLIITAIPLVGSLLIGRGREPEAAKHRTIVICLLTFAATTYLIAPVRGFGWMLMLLGAAQCDQRDKGFRPLYLAAILLIQIYTLPVATVWSRLAGS